MRRITLAVLTMLLCLLCACGGKEKTVQAPMEFRTRLLQAGGCSCTLNAVEDFDGFVCDFSLDCGCRADGSAEVCVTAPESVAGIRAATDGKTGKLSFDGMQVSFGVAEDARLAPLSVPATLINAWTGGYIASSGKDGGLECAVFELGYGDETLKVYTWLTSDGLPERVELALGGKVLCRAEITDFRYDGGNNEAAETDLG